MKLVTDRQYDPEAITIESMLSRKTSISRFLGKGGSTVLSKLDKEEKKDLARQLYLHAELVDTVENTPFFSRMSLTVAEPVFNEEYELLSSEKAAFAAGGLNKTKETGETMVYSLIDSWGLPNVSANFELASFIKDKVKCKEVILDYDSYDPAGGLNVNVIVTFPVVDENFQVDFCRSVQTWFNNNIMSNSDLVELE